jgi:hypothetical protein
MHFREHYKNMMAVYVALTGTAFSAWRYGLTFTLPLTLQINNSMERKDMHPF